VGRLGRLAFGARRQLRVVGQRRADPDGHGVDRCAPAMPQLAAVLAADPLRVARPRRDLAVERHRRLEQHPGAAYASVLAKGLVEQPRARGELAVGKHDLDPFVAQDPEAATGRLLGRVVGGDDHAPDPRLDDRVGARRGLALVAARLQRHVQRGVGKVLQAARLDRVDLRVRPAELGVPALAEDLLAARDDRADYGVGLDRPHPVARELDRALQVRLVGVCLDRHAHPG